MKNIKISNSEHNAFVENHINGDLCQLTAWANVKSKYWYSRRVAVADNNGILCGVALMLFRKIPFTSRTICYIPRGFVCDYNKKDIVSFILEEAKKIAIKERAILLSIDPVIERNQIDDLKEYLLLLGFKHKGYTTGFVDNQPRFSMITSLPDTADKLFRSFSQRTRNSIKKGNRYDLEFEVITSNLETTIHHFNKLMKTTGERDNFLIRDNEYFVKLLNSLGKENAELIYVKMNLEKTKQVLANELNMIVAEKAELFIKPSDDVAFNRETKIRKLLVEISKLSNLKEIYLSGAILTFCGNKSYYLYGASSNDFRELLPNYFMQWNMMQRAINRKCTSYDFGGISGNINKNDPEYGLYDFKRRFNSRIVERIGQFDYILNPFYHSIYTITLKSIRLFRRFKKSLSKISRGVD